MSCRALGLNPFLLYLMTGVLYCTDTEHRTLSLPRVPPGRRATPSYLNVLIADHLQDPDVDVLLAYKCENGVNVLKSINQTH